VIAYFNRFSIEMTKEQARSCSHQGRCDDDVAYLCEDKKIKRQLKKISDEDLKEELREYGIWDEEELQDRKENEERIIWIAAGDILAN
jgi:hypothetical protein